MPWSSSSEYIHVTMTAENIFVNPEDWPTDIVGSSIQAYISALNKIVYEEAEA